MRVLITGGAGYIGSHTAKVLAASGHTPIVLDNLQNGHRCAVRWGPFAEADLADTAALREVFAQYHPEIVIHFAAFAYVGESMHHPDKYFRNNLVNTLNLLDTMRHTEVKHIVFSSTCATYGVPTRTPICEDHSQSPVNPYGESKLMVEKVLRWYGQAYGISSVCLRYFNAAGADPDGEIGEDHDPETHLIPRAIQAALGVAPPLEIFGVDYETRDGTAVRDYVHVMDLATAHLQAMEYLQSHGESAVFNLGTGSGATVDEVIAAIERVGGRKVSARRSGRRAGDPPVLLANSAKAAAILQWRPHYDLESIVASAWHWHAARLH